MSKILVTGASGMIGSAIKELNLRNVVYLSHKDLDLRDFLKTLEIFQEIKPTHIIHTAAIVGGVGGNSAHPGQYFLDNIKINTNVLEAARQTGVEKLVSFMSTCIFPNECTYPLSEKDLHKGEPHSSNFGYAYAKRMLDVQNRAYHKEYGCNFVSVIPTNIYGPFDNYSIENGHVLPALIHKIYLAKKNEIPFIVWGSGEPLREFVYSSDIAKLSLWILDNYNENDPIILTSGIENSIKEMVYLIAEKIKFTGEIIFDKTKPDGQFRKPSNNTKLKKHLPNFKFITVEEGISKTVDWFLNNYPNIRK
ncbi:GDP-L-fucose synthase [Patescibacteria group bacterium]|nr:GDP-L-fucose synthase [Patescibacteria group bacterium]